MCEFASRKCSASGDSCRYRVQCSAEREGFMRGVVRQGVVSRSGDTYCAGGRAVETAVTEGAHLHDR